MTFEKRVKRGSMSIWKDIGLFLPRLSSSLSCLTLLLFLVLTPGTRLDSRDSRSLLSPEEGRKVMEGSRWENFLHLKWSQLSGTGSLLIRLGRVPQVPNISELGAWQLTFTLIINSVLTNSLDIFDNNLCKSENKKNFLFLFQQIFSAAKSDLHVVKILKIVFSNSFPWFVKIYSHVLNI